MNPINLDEVEEYVSNNMVDFYERAIQSIQEVSLRKLLKKNPYLFKIKNNILSAPELVRGLLEAFLSSSEEKLFGDFLEDLAIFIAGKTCNGHKSTAPGVDLEFFNKRVHYVVSVKSGPSWGNSSQQRKLEEDLRNAVVRLKQSKRGANVQPVLGICYGKTKTSYVRGYLKVVGQNFWYLISENKRLYIDIIEPISHKANEHNKKFLNEKSCLINRLTKQFIGDFCRNSGAIDWTKLVEFNSCNYDLDRVLP